MSYVELKYYHSYGLEVRELGETGWAIHVYAPSRDKRSGKVAIIETAHPSGLQQALAEAQAAVDRDMTQCGLAVRHG
jgi:hypothetical protein